jgi:hypothetical protein
LGRRVTGLVREEASPSSTQAPHHASLSVSRRSFCNPDVELGSCVNIWCGRDLEQDVALAEDRFTYVMFAYGPQDAGVRILFMIQIFKRC